MWFVHVVASSAVVVLHVELFEHNEFFLVLLLLLVKNVAKKSCGAKNLGRETEESTLAKKKKVVFYNF